MISPTPSHARRNHKNPSILPRFAGLGLALAAAVPGAALAQSAPSGADPSNDALRRQVESLQSTVASQASRLDSQAGEIARMKAQQGEDWLTAERAAEIRGIVTDVLADSSTRASLVDSGATSGYDKGFFIASPDGNFLLRINGQLQARYAVSRLSTASQYQLDPGTFQGAQTGLQAQQGVLVFPGGTEIKGYQGMVGGVNNIPRTARGFELRRVKLEFSGHVVDPSWQYKIQPIVNQTSSQTDFTTITDSSAQVGGVQSIGPAAGNGSAGPGAGGGLWGLEDCYVNKKINDCWSVKVGQFKSPFMREELVSSKYQLAVERSLVNQLFSTKFTQGVEVTFVSDMFRVIGSFNDGGNNANTSAIIGQRDNSGDWTEYAITGRAEWKIAGKWAQFDDFNCYNGQEFGADIGAGVNWQRGGGANRVAWPNTWTVGGGANGNFAAVGGGAVGPIAALQYPNNIPTNGNDDVNNLSWTVDTTWDFGGWSVFAAVVGNIAYNIPAGWVANPSGGFFSSPNTSPPSPANNVNSNVSFVTSGAQLANGQPGPSAAVFVPGYGFGNQPIYSYGVVVQAGLFIVDDVELFGRYEWYDVVNNGANGYAGNTPTYWGLVPGGSSPFANNSNAGTTNPGFPGPNKGVNTPNDSYLAGNTNPYYAYNFGANPYAAQTNNIITFGFNWYPAGYKNRQIKLTGDVGYAFNPVLFVNGIYGQSVGGADYRSDGGLGGGGQIVTRIQLQLLF